MEYINTMSDCVVISAKEGNEAGEGMRFEVRWLECESTVPAPRAVTI